MSHVTPADALPIINQISRAAPAKSDDAFFFRGSFDEDGASSIALEVHCIRVITQNDAVAEANFDEFAASPKGVLDDDQTGQFVFTEGSDGGLAKDAGLTFDPPAHEAGDGWQTIPPIYIRIDDPHGSYDQTDGQHDLLFA